MKKHTPGPWIVDGDLIQAEDRTVAHEVNNEHDARLIAAAPEMAALLRRAWRSLPCNSLIVAGFLDDTRKLLQSIEGRI